MGACKSGKLLWRHCRWRPARPPRINYNFFDVEKHPTLTFKSRRVEAAGAGKLRLAGDLTMHGILDGGGAVVGDEVAVTIDIELVRRSAPPRNSQRRTMVPMRPRR